VAEQSAMLIPHITNAERLWKRISRFALLKDCTAQLTQAGLRVYEIKRSKVDDRNCDGIRVFTMPRVKGLEFSYTFFAAVNKCIVLLASAINRTDVTVEAESITAEKCRLYVTLTRAQKRACITCYGTASEFLE
jgi:superfamily I DNA/RNA helicase